MTDLSNFSMLDLFRAEMENHLRTLNEGLLKAENDPAAKPVLESLMRAAHSIKGAARIVQIDPVVKVAHAMEDCFVAAINAQQGLKAEHNDVLLKGIDFLSRVATITEQELTAWQAQHASEAEALVSALSALRTAKTAAESAVQTDTARTTAETQRTEPASAAAIPVKEGRNVRVDAENLNRLVALSGESLVSAGWLQPFAARLREMNILPRQLSEIVDRLQQEMEASAATAEFQEIRDKLEVLQDQINRKFEDLETYSRRTLNLSKRLYREALASRMRPFADGVEGFPRMVRDVARKLGKNVKFVIEGKSTRVDRDILEKLEAPLTHLLRNAVDHGIEFPEERVTSGKPVEGMLRLSASHRAGILLITVSDDGRGIDYGRLREKIVSKKLTTAAMVEKMTEKELIEFLFLPGFSTAEAVTEISGRGFGLDVVANMVREVGGSLQAVSEERKGIAFHLQLPLTLSVIRALIVLIAEEHYAIPLSRIDRIAMAEPSDIRRSGSTVHFQHNGSTIPVADAAAVLELLQERDRLKQKESLFLVILGEGSSRYGLVVDQIVGQTQLAVRPLDSRLGKVQDVNAAALMENGMPVLILDVPELLYSISNYLNRSAEDNAEAVGDWAMRTKKRVLVVDDSVTVREVERKILESAGYEVDIAADGLEALIAMRTSASPYDLLITDVDMPRLNGIELITRLKDDPNLRHVPVIMISYKDRVEDRQKGMRAGADSYLTKSDFSEEALLEQVQEILKQKP